MRPLALLLGISLTANSILLIQPSLAETPKIPAPSQAPLKLNFITNPPSYVTTANTIRQSQLTIPSLWWAKENSTENLLENWIAYPPSETEPARVDLLVNQQVWSTLEYLGRYDFVNRLGSVARDYGYNTRVFNYQQELLATYTCNLSVSPPLCDIEIFIPGRLGVKRSILDNNVN